MFKDLREFIDHLEKSKELVRIDEEMSPEFEIPGVMKYLDKTLEKPAVFFKKVKGYDVPIVGNLLGSRKRLAMAMGTEEESISEEYRKMRGNPIKPKVLATGPIKDVVLKDGVDIMKVMPVLIHSQKDVGPYLTSAVALGKSPVTGLRGMGIHRVLIKDKDTIGIWLATPPLSQFLKEAEERNQPLDIAIAIGMDPLTFFSSVIWAPEGIDKFDITGGIAGEPIGLVKGETVNVEYPAEAEFVLEGQIFPHKREKEGPFGESTGYYFTDYNPVAIIKAICHRKNPVYQALMVWTTEESVLTDISWEMENLKKMQETFPNIKKVRLKTIGLLAIVQIDKKSDEEGQKIIDHVMNNFPFIKWVVLVDTDVDIYDDKEVDWAMVTRTQPDRNMIIKSNLPGLMIDPSTTGGEREEFATLITKTSKLGIDATKPLGEQERYEKIDIPENLKEKVLRIAKGAVKR